MSGLGALADLIDPPRAGVLGYLGDPSGFARDCIRWDAGEGPTFYQSRALDRLAERHRLALRGPHGLGKSALAAWAVLWFSLTRDAAGRDWKVVTAAPSWVQLRQYLWPAIRTLWLPRIDWQRVGREPLSATELLTLELRLRHGSAFAVGSEDPTRIEGAHAESLLFLLDEARGIPDAIWDSVEGATTGGREAYVLAVSTPGEPVGRFAAICNGDAGTEDWHAEHVTKQEAIAAGRMTRAWARRRAALWGRHSPLYRRKVLGEFAREDEQAAIPAPWIEAAMTRHAEGGEREEMTCIGLDVAHEGTDKTVLAIRHGLRLDRLVKYRGISTTETGNRAAAIVKGTTANVIVDADGLGVGALDRLRELEIPTVAFHGNGKTDRRDRTGELGFTNWRTAAIWHLREILDPERGSEVQLPEDDELLADLAAIRWQMKDSRVQVEPKREIAKRIKRSPDCGDAVALAFWPGAQTRIVRAPEVLVRPGGSPNRLSRRQGGYGGF